MPTPGSGRWRRRAWPLQVRRVQRGSVRAERNVPRGRTGRRQDRQQRRRAGSHLLVEQGARKDALLGVEGAQVRRPDQEVGHDGRSQRDAEDRKRPGVDRLGSERVIDFTGMRSEHEPPHRPAPALLPRPRVGEQRPAAGRAAELFLELLEPAGLGALPVAPFVSGLRRSAELYRIPSPPRFSIAFASAQGLDVGAGRPGTCDVCTSAHVGVGILADSGLRLQKNMWNRRTGGEGKAERPTVSYSFGIVTCQRRALHIVTAGVTATIMG